MAAHEKKHGFLYHQTHQGPDGRTAEYVLFVPHDYTGDKPSPLILFLHGRGESGRDGRKPVEVGLGPAIKKQEQSFPFLVIFPQSQEYTWHAHTADANRALAILGEVEKQYCVDPSRIYLTGLSMGGFGVWSLATNFPERWAVLAPICGGGSPLRAERIKDIPCWCFHGARDDVVSVARSREMIAALQAAGGQPRYTEYPDVGHASWVNAYATQELYTWLLQQQKK
jgi:predicted peptidase